MHQTQHTHSRHAQLTTLYHARIAADIEFGRQLRRQFGAKAVQMRYVWPKIGYDAETMAAYEAKVAADAAEVIPNA